MIANLTRHLFRPTKGGAAALVIIFAPLLSLVATRAGLLGIPMFCILSSWFFKYAYILFDHASRGFDEPPVLDTNMINPVNEQRPLGQAAIVCAVVFGLVYVHQVWGPIPTTALLILSALVLPASVAVLGLEGSVLQAAKPFSWLKMIYGLGYWYGLILVLISLIFLALYGFMQFGLWLFVNVAIGMFGFLSVFSLLGGAVYEQRDTLGIVAWRSPERDAELERKQQHRGDEAAITEAYGLMRADAHTKSWELLQNWLKTQGSSVDAYQWLCERLEKWEDVRYITRLTEEFIERLMQLRRSGEALKVLMGRLRSDQQFRPKSAADTLSLAQLAARGGGSTRTARTLLADFAARYPNDPRIEVAVELSKHLNA